MPVTIEALSRHLSLIEHATLDHVHNGKWDKAPDGTWQARPGNEQDVKELAANWTSWRSRYAELGKTIKDLNGADITAALNAVDRAVNFELFFTGASDSKWKIVFDYEKHFRMLRKRLLEVSIEHNENAIFRARHQEAFEKFRAVYPQTWNVFIGISYAEGYDLAYIRRLLQDLERVHNNELKFHRADEHQYQNWLDNQSLYDNMRFLMLACDAGLFFFTHVETQSRDRSKKRQLHNPNVVFEFGFMRGLGKTSIMFRDTKVEQFTDVRGDLDEPYEGPDDLELRVKSFLRNRLRLGPAGVAEARR